MYPGVQVAIAAETLPFTGSVTKRVPSPGSAVSMETRGSSRSFVSAVACAAARQSRIAARIRISRNAFICFMLQSPPCCRGYVSVAIYAVIVSNRRNKVNKYRPHGGAGTDVPVKSGGGEPFPASVFIRLVLMPSRSARGAQAP